MRLVMKYLCFLPALLILFIELIFPENLLAQPGEVTSSVTAPHVVVGDPAVGKELFTGSARLANGGPPCMACHSVSGIGALGGGALGPDLTEAHKKFGEMGLQGILMVTPFPTMRPVYEKRLLIPEERAHLIAFLGAAPLAKRPIHAVGVLLGLSSGGAGILLALMKLKWRRRLKGVRKEMVNRS